MKKNNGTLTDPFTEWIDRDNKRINLPPDVEHALMQHKSLWEFFHQLAWSHRREYLMWILEAKKQETREKRIEGMLARLEEARKKSGNR